MTDPVPSKERDIDRILVAFDRACDYSSLSGMVRISLSNARAVLDEVERLRTALRGIQSCSSCEACRGAATIALGGSAPEPCALQRIIEAYDAYRARGVAPAPNQYANLVAAIEAARAAQPPGAGQ